MHCLYSLGFKQTNKKLGGGGGWRDSPRPPKVFKDCWVFSLGAMCAMKHEWDHRKGLMFLFLFFSFFFFTASHCVAGKSWDQRCCPYCLTNKGCSFQQVCRLCVLCFRHVYLLTEVTLKEVEMLKLVITLLYICSQNSLHCAHQLTWKCSIRRTMFLVLASCSEW